MMTMVYLLLLLQGTRSQKIMKCYINLYKYTSDATPTDCDDDDCYRRLIVVEMGFLSLLFSYYGFFCVSVYCFKGRYFCVFLVNFWGKGCERKGLVTDFLELGFKNVI